MFKDKIDKFTNKTPGFWGCVIIGIDGIPVEERSVSDKINLEATATEYITLLKKSNQINQQENLGIVKEIIFQNANILILLNHINSEYYLLAAFDPAINLGLVRYRLTTLVKELANDIG